jgi:HlyD family secretion protein
MLGGREMRAESHNQTMAIRDTSVQDIPVSGNVLRTKSRRFWVITSLVVVAIAAATILSITSITKRQLSIPISRVQIGTVDRGRFVRDVVARGTVVAANSRQMFSPVTGLVSIKVAAGETVGKGQLLASIDSPDAVSELAQERATLESLSNELSQKRVDLDQESLKIALEEQNSLATLQKAERELARAEAAWSLKAIARRELEWAQDSVNSARVQYEFAQSRAKLEQRARKTQIRASQLAVERQSLLVDELSRRVDSLTVSSPVDGVVGALELPDKATVLKNAAILSVIDLSNLEVEFSVPETYSSEIAPEMAAVVTYLGKPFDATVASISPQVQAGEVKGRIRFNSTPPRGMRQNQRVNVQVVIASTPSALKLPRGTLVDERSFVYRLTGSIAQRHPVALGQMSMNEVEVLKGLEEGDRVVISTTASIDGLEEFHIQE